MHNAQGLKEQVDSKLSMVQEIRFEPRLLSEGDDRLKHGSQIGQLHCPKHILSIHIYYR